MSRAKSALNTAAVKLHMLLLNVNRKVVAIGSAFFGFFIFGAAPVLAAPTLFEKLEGSFMKVYVALVALAPIVTGVAYVIAKIWQIAVPEKQGRAEPREWARNALVNYFFILAAGGIIGFIAEVASGIGNDLP